MLFVTFYQVAGERCDGTYLVNAATKKEANRIVKAVDKDYCRVSSMKQDELPAVEFEELIDGVTVPEPGHAVQLECGS